MNIKVIPRQMKRLSRKTSKLKITLKSAICLNVLCCLTIAVLVRYTSNQPVVITTKSVNVARLKPMSESKKTNYLIKRNLNLANIGVDLLTEKHIIRNVSSTPKVASFGTPKPIYPVTLEAKYILENPNLCNHVKNLSVLIYIHSAPNHFSRRQFIRNTYANASFFRPFGILRVLFLLGTVNDFHVQEHIAEEFHKYSDILQGDFIDAYENLTLKGVTAYKWISDKCQNADVVLKADDDVVINMYKLLTEYLPAFKKKSKTILCHHLPTGTMPIIRDKKSKWYVKESEFRGQTYYPQYCSGFFVMITNDVIPAIYRSAHLTPFFWVDDVYMYGLLPTQIQGITYTGLKEGTFDISDVNALDCYKNASRVCDYLVVHGLNGNQEDMIEIWKFMTLQQKEGLLGQSEI